MENLQINDSWVELHNLYSKDIHLAVESNCVNINNKKEGCSKNVSHSTENISQSD